MLGEYEYLDAYTPLSEEVLLYSSTLLCLFVAMVNMIVKNTCDDMRMCVIFDSSMTLLFNALAMVLRYKYICKIKLAYHLVFVVTIVEEFIKRNFGYNVTAALLITQMVINLCIAVILA